MGAGHAAWEVQRAGGGAGAGPGQNKGRTHLRRSRAGRRARTWVSAAQSAARAAAGMARSGDAGRPMSHAGRRRRNCFPVRSGQGGRGRERARGRGRSGGRVAARPGCGRGRRGGKWASRRPRWLPWRPPARSRRRPRPRPGSSWHSPASRGLQQPISGGCEYCYLLQQVRSFFSLLFSRDCSQSCSCTL